jgi:hypothetical protein
LPPFAPSWESLEDSWSLPDAKPVLTPTLKSTSVGIVEETTASGTGQQVEVKIAAI